MEHVSRDVSVVRVIFKSVSSFWDTDSKDTGRE